MADDLQAKSAVDVWFGRVPAIIAVLSIISLLASMVHEWGCFWVISPTFLTLLTPSDHFGNALIWLGPTAVTAGFITATLVSALTFLQWILPRKRGINYPAVIGGIVAVSIFGGFVFYTDRSDIEAFALISSLVALVFTSGPVINVSHRRYTVVFTAFAVLVVLWTIFFLGKQDAKNDLLAFSPVYRITFKEDDLTARHVVLLRTLEKGVIVHDPVERRVEFVRWDSLLGLSKFIVPSGNAAMPFD